MFPREPGEDRTAMTTLGKLLDTLVNMHPEVCRDFAVLKKGKRVLHVEILKAIYGMLEAALLWHPQFRNDMEEHGFVFNDYDLCLANKTVKGKQQTM